MCECQALAAVIGGYVIVMLAVAWRYRKTASPWAAVFWPPFVGALTVALWQQRREEAHDG